MVATGDDFGRVKLFRWPACNKDSPAHSNAAHSSHVTNVPIYTALLVDRWCVLISRVVAQVRFNKDGRFLVSTGGMDTATIVWRHLF